MAFSQRPEGTLCGSEAFGSCNWDSPRIELGLSLHEATGCGVWAAGAAGRMPTLADKVPDYTDCVTIAGEPDDAGRKGAVELAKRLKARGLYCELRILGGEEALAA